MAVMPSDGGEARVITDFELGAGAPAWSPDGSSILVTGTLWYGRWAGLDEDERSLETPEGHRFRRPAGRPGLAPRRRTYAYLVDPRGDTPPRRVGCSDEHESGPAWSPDGAKVAMVTSRDNPRSLESGSEVVEVEVDGAPRRCGPGGPATSRPTTTRRATCTPSATQPRLSLRLLPVEARRTAGRYHRTPGQKHQRPAHVRRPGEADLAGDGFLAAIADRGRASVVAFGPDGAVRTVLGGDRYITGLSRAASGRLAFTATDPTCPGELYELTPEGRSGA